MRPLLESRLQAARERNIPPEGGTPARSCATELASSESSSLESRLQAARQTRFFMFIRMPENRPAPRMQRVRGADRPDRSERIQLYERMKCPPSDYSGDTAKALHCQRDNSKTGGVPINQPTGLKYRCRNRMDRLPEHVYVRGGVLLIIAADRPACHFDRTLKRSCVCGDNRASVRASGREIPDTQEDPRHAVFAAEFVQGVVGGRSQTRSFRGGVRPGGLAIDGGHPPLRRRSICRLSPQSKVVLFPPSSSQLVGV